MTSSRRALRAVLYAGGTLATVTGFHTAATGARSLPGQEPANPVIESELRFFAAIYVAFGLTALRVAPHADREPERVRALMAAILLAGLARAGAWRATGKPHPGQRLLLAVELTLPPAVAALQRRV